MKKTFVAAILGAAAGALATKYYLEYRKGKEVLLDKKETVDDDLDGYSFSLGNELDNEQDYLSSKEVLEENPFEGLEPKKTRRGGLCRKSKKSAAKDL